MDNFDDEPRQIWVTLFDHLDDDLYDGDFTYNDTEVPRLCLEFGDAEKRGVKTSHRVTTSAAKRTEKKEAVSSTVTTTVTKTVTTSSSSQPQRVTTTITKYVESEGWKQYQPILQFEVGAEPQNSNG